MNVKKIVITSILFFIKIALVSANINDSLYTALKLELDKKNYYVQQKEDRMKGIKKLLSSNSITDMQQYIINYQLYDEYEKYQIDSAILYVNKNIYLARKMESSDLLYESQLILAPLYSTKGLYIDALKILESISSKDLNSEQKGLYYRAYSLFYRHYAQSSGVSNIYNKSDLYKDSLIMVLDPHSTEYMIESVQRHLNGLENIPSERDSLYSLLSRLDMQSKEYALVAYLIGYSYELEGNKGLQTQFYILSAIADIKNSIKDNASIQSLAKLFFDDGKGNIDLAYECNKSSMEDAIFCNVRYRTIDSSNTYPIITATYQQKEKEQKKTLILSLVLSSILSLSLVIALVYIYRQMKRVAKIRKELYRANLALNKLNNDLHQVNIALEDANNIKERYIAYSFDLCSNYIDKIEKFKNSLNKRFQTKKVDDIARMLSSDELISNELKEFYHNFDRMFLDIYPTFVEEFNSLLIDDQNLKIKEGDLLSPELRIFALIRLGIKDSTRIASYLHYSMSTIYNYRTKVKSKSNIPRDEFEDHVMLIGNISFPK